MRKALFATSSSCPIARSILLAFTVPLEQAEPLLTEIPSRSSAMSRFCDLVLGKLKKHVLATRWDCSPCIMMFGDMCFSCVSSLLRSCSKVFRYRSRFLVAAFAAAPNPAIPATLCVPARAYFSCPPPSKRVGVCPHIPKASAPTPCGPPILWEESVKKSMPLCVAWTGMRPALCVASQWNRAPYLCATPDNSETFCIDPVSLLTCIHETRDVFVFKRFSRLLRHIRPSCVTGAVFKFGKFGNASVIEGCSIADIMICSSGYACAKCCKTVLLPSVAPLLKIIWLLGMPTISAMCLRAASMVFCPSRPKWCIADALCAPFSGVVRRASMTAQASGWRGALAL